MPLRSPIDHVFRRLTRDAGRSGFSLVEILIVIVMISLLALVAIPRFSTANGKRQMESARMRIAAGLATARAAAIQKGEPVRFQINSGVVTVKRVTGDTTDLISPVKLDPLYKVNASGYTNPLRIDFGGRGFATNLSATQTIRLTRSGTPDDSVVVMLTGMVKR